MTKQEGTLLSLSHMYVPGGCSRVAPILARIGDAPRVEYELTPLGRSLLRPIEHLGVWVMDNVDAIEKAQRRYDKAAAK